MKAFPTVVLGLLAVAASGWTPGLQAQTTLVDALLGPPTTTSLRQQWQNRAIQTGGAATLASRSARVVSPETASVSAYRQAQPIRAATARGRYHPAVPEAAYARAFDPAAAAPGLAPPEGEAVEAIPTPPPQPIAGSRQLGAGGWIEPSTNQSQWDAQGEFAAGGAFPASPDDGAFGGYDRCGCGQSCDAAWPGENCGSCGGWEDAWGSCGDCGLSAEVHRLWWRNLSLWAGVHGFKGPFDEGLNGNFGFHEGVNLGMPLGLPWAVGFQIGFQATHSNFKGEPIQLGNQQITWNTADRNQIFLTGGLFRRAVFGGMQWGVAVDFLHDDYYDVADVARIRTEAGYVFSGGRELGYWGAYGTNSDRILTQQVRLLEPTDMFAFYYRRYFTNGGEGRIWAGFTGQGDGILGADVRLALGGSWGLENHANYIIAKQGSANGGQREESWGISINLVWYPGRPASCVVNQVYRPLLSVADNSLFATDMGRAP